MTYRQLQLALKELRNAGKTTIKLNAKKTVLQAEYDRLTKGAMVVAAVPAQTKAAPAMETREAKINRLFDALRANQQAELANAATIYTVATMAVKKIA